MQLRGVHWFSRMCLGKILLILLSTPLSTLATKIYQFTSFNISVNYPDNWIAATEDPWDLELKMTSSISPRLAFKFWNQTLTHKPYYGIKKLIQDDISDTSYQLNVLAYGGIEVAGHWGYYCKYTTDYVNNPYLFYNYSVWFSIPSISKDVEIIYNASGSSDQFSANSDILLCEQVIKSMIISGDNIPNRYRNVASLYSPDSSISVNTPSNIIASIKQEVTPNGKQFIGIDDTYDRILGGFTIKWKDTTITNWKPHAKTLLYNIIPTLNDDNTGDFVLIDSQATDCDAHIAYYSGYTQPNPLFTYQYFTYFNNKVTEIKILCEKYSVDSYGFYYDSLLAKIYFNKNASISNRPIRNLNSSSNTKSKNTNFVLPFNYRKQEINFTGYDLMGRKFLPENKCLIRQPLITVQNTNNAPLLYNK